MPTVRNRSDINLVGQWTRRGNYLFLFFCLAPSLAFAENGALGPVSVASSQLTIVVPEQFETLDVRSQDGKLLTCGNFSNDFAFLSISGTSVVRLKPETGASNCKTGQMFVSPQVAGVTSIFVPSSAF